MRLFSKSLSIVLRYGGQLLNVIFSYSSARCISWRGFAVIRVSCHRVIHVMLLDCVSCTRLIRTRIIIYSVSFHLLLPELDITELRPQLIHWSSKYRGVVLPNLQGIYCVPRFVFGMTFPTQCLTPGRWMGSMVQSSVGCSMSCVFFSCPWHRCKWGCESNL